MDLVEHLRREASKQDMLACEDMLQAADEIEKLRDTLRFAAETIDSLDPRGGTLVHPTKEQLIDDTIKQIRKILPSDNGPDED